MSISYVFAFITKEMLLTISPVIGTVVAALIGYMAKAKIEEGKRERFERQLIAQTQSKFVDDLQEEFERMRVETSELRQSVADLQRTNIELIFENKNLQVTIKELMTENKELKNTVENLMITLEQHKGA